MLGLGTDWLAFAFLVDLQHFLQAPADDADRAILLRQLLGKLLDVLGLHDVALALLHQAPAKRQATVLLGVL